MPSGLALRLTRSLHAPRTAVYRALTDPAELAKWWGPRGFTTPTVVFDPRVGGSYRIAMQPPDGARFELSGEFCEVDPGTRLSYTFRWDPPDPADRETVVTLSLLERGEWTDVVLTHGAFATEARRALHEQGWSDSLARLEQLLATNEPARAPHSRLASEFGANVMDEFLIVECGPADAEELAEICRATFLDTYSADTSPDDMREYLREAYRPETLRAELDTPGSRFFIARAGEAAAGYLKLNTGDAQGERLEGTGLEIEAIYVHRRNQGMGIGKLMLARAQAEAEAIGADHIWLGVWERNHAAIRFYERNGFAQVGLRPFRFGAVLHTDLIMRLNLRP